MLSKISWAEYLLVMGILVSAYYLFILVRFYSSDLMEIILRNRKEKLPNLADVPEQGQAERQLFNEPERYAQPFEQTTDDTFEHVEHLITALQQIISESADQQADKEEFASRLTGVIYEYPQLKDSAFEQAINELILTECSKYGYLPLNEQEIGLLW